MVKPYPYNKSSQYAIKYGYSARTGGKLTDAAKTIQRAFRSKRQLIFLKKHVPTAMKMRRTYSMKGTKYGSRMKVTQPKQRSLAFSPNEAFLNSFLGMGILYQNVVSMPQSNASAAVINSKGKQHLYVKGIRFCRSFEFFKPTSGEEASPTCPPIMMHWAVIQLKEPNVPFENWKDEISNKFFRTFDDTYDKVENFIDNDDSSLWSTDKNWNRINPDGNMNILTHRKRVLTQNDRTEGDIRIRPYLWQIDTYMPIKKTLIYSNSDQPYPDNPLFEVYWFQTLTPTDYPYPSNADLVTTFRQHTVYYA